MAVSVWREKAWFRYGNPVPFPSRFNRDLAGYGGIWWDISRGFPSPAVTRRHNGIFGRARDVDRPAADFSVRKRHFAPLNLAGHNHLYVW